MSKKKRFEKPIEWTKEKEAELYKAINRFNKKVKSLKSKRKDKSYLPDTLLTRGTKRLITTEKERLAVIESLNKFKGEGLKKVTLKSGEKITKWEYDELKKQQKKAKARLQKRLKELEKPSGLMGNEEYNKVSSALKSVRDFEKLKGTSFDVARERIGNYGSYDYEMRKAIQYKKNYLKMLKEEFKGEKNYNKLIHKIRMTNPMQFFEDLQMMELNEYLIDITYMYTSMNNEECFDTLVDFYLTADEEGE